MKRVELYGQVRRAVYVEGVSRREAARRFGIDPRTVAKMLAFSVPPGYRRSRPPARPKLDPFLGIIDRILEEDKLQPAKQQHTSKRVFERLRDEHGYAGGITIVKDYVHGRRQRLREMFVPMRHDPGHAQVDFGEALAVIAGEERKIHFFAMDLPHSDGCLVQAYPAESTEAFCEGHRVSFEFFGGVPRSILYDYVARHIIVFLCPSRLCAGCEQTLDIVDRESQEWARNFRRQQTLPFGAACAERRLSFRLKHSQRHISDDPAP